jgi:hypothetical protein
MRKITEEEAGPDWAKKAIWAEYGSPHDFIEALNIALAKHNLELVEIDAKLSDLPLLLKSTTEK